MVLLVKKIGVVEVCELEIYYRDFFGFLCSYYFRLFIINGIRVQ